FERKGVIIIDNEDDRLDKDSVMLDAIEAGASDMEAGEGLFEVTTAPDDFQAVANALEKAGYTFLSAQVEMVPGATIRLDSEDDLKNMRKMLEMFEDNDDVQNVWHNWEE
ncbi:MAG: YebC/PmpR family DNA-binding transcriptional regulator, partial [Firmicutes bacterium]|nr:YebC/PmpR family DNA-binding transcriptional regulator [Bacillota bacterium]